MTKKQIGQEILGWKWNQQYSFEIHSEIKAQNNQINAGFKILRYLKKFLCVTEFTPSAIDNYQRICPEWPQ